MAPTVRKLLIPLAVAATLGGMASNAVAGGFAIGTQSGSGTGNAFAGGAAAADDASVAWSNPAAMTLIPGRQVAGALHILKPSFKFSDNGSTGPVFGAAGASDGGDGGDWAFVPNGFMTIAINPKLSFGLALNVPFGLKTEYDTPWRGQLTAIKSEIKTVNINPSVAYKISDTVSIGAGVSVQYIDATLSSANATGTNITEITADDIGYGFNVGLMIQAAPDTRIGVTYRSAIKFDLEGNATFSAVAAANPGIKADLKVPDSASLSVFHKMNPNWELMGDVTWTGWSSVQRLNVNCTSTTAVPGICNTVGSTLSSLVLNWDDTWRFGVGANYKLNDQTKLRFGAALDKTPTNDVDRTARLPDQDRTWLAFGVQYKPSKTGILDVGYAHEFIKDATVNNTVAGAGTLSGTFKNKADIFSIQYSHSF